MRHRLDLLPSPPPAATTPDEAGRAYDAVADAYLRYADGSGDRLFGFDSRYAFADREVWRRIEAALVDLRAQGRETIRILDLGCGPGTWLLRAALRARSLGFARVEALGDDVSAELVALAMNTARGVAEPAIRFDFAVEDMETALRDRRDRSCDLVLCLYGVLNHVPTARHAAIARQLARVASGHVILTVRAAGSPPSLFVTGIEDAFSYHRDPDRDRLEVDLRDGRHLEFHSHLFGAEEVRALFAPLFDLHELAGLDLFHCRFRSDPHWQPEAPADARFEARLAGLERLCANDPEMIDHAAHILLSCVARADPGGHRPGPAGAG